VAMTSLVHFVEEKLIALQNWKTEWKWEELE
jgi:hypothetical protein